MKTKARIIVKSLADLPADAFALAASVPERAFAATKQVLVPPCAWPAGNSAPPTGTQPS